MNLHDKVQEKRKSAQQKELDEGQDKQIKQLQAKVDKMQPGKGDESDSGSRSRSRSRRRRRRSTGDDGYKDEDFDRNARRSRAMIERQFEDNVRRVGQRYARGDVIAENKLQAQIITLQQTVINVLQDALLNGQRLSNADIHRLIAAQDSARQGSLDALQDQCDRMLEEPKRMQAIEYDRPRSPPRRQLTLPSPEYAPDNGLAPVRRVQTLPLSSGSSSPTLVYCRYAHDLQRDLRKPLSPAFSPAGSQRCPSCDVRISVSTTDVWVFETRTPVRAQRGDYDEDLVELRSFSMDARLVLKSHTPSGELLCWLCYRERDADCVCGSVDQLVKHLGRVHTAEEFEREEDMFLERPQK